MPSRMIEKLFNPQSLQIPPMAALPDDVEIAEAAELMHQILVSDVGGEDVFIDDTFAFAVNLPGSDNIRGLERGTLLALDAISRPLETTTYPFQGTQWLQSWRRRLETI